MSDKTKTAQQKHPSAAAAVSARQAHRVTLTQKSESILNDIAAFERDDVMCNLVHIIANVAKTIINNVEDGETPEFTYDQIDILESLYKLGGALTIRKNTLNSIMGPGNMPLCSACFSDACYRITEYLFGEYHKTNVLKDLMRIIKNICNSAIHDFYQGATPFFTHDQIYLIELFYNLMASIEPVCEPVEA